MIVCSRRPATDDRLQQEAIFEPALQALRVSDGMKGGTPTILYDLCLGLDKLYSEPIENPRVANCMTCSWHGGMRFTHLCTVLASSWTKHSAVAT